MLDAQKIGLFFLILRIFLVPLPTKADTQSSESRREHSYPIFIPFDLVGGRSIFLSGQCGYKIVAFQLDTGTDMTFWPATLDLAEIKKAKMVTSRDILNKPFLGASCVLPKLSFGDFVTTNVHSIATYPSSQTSVSSPLGGFTDTPALSNEVFVSHKIVLDFERKFLEIRDSTEKHIRTEEGKNELTVPFEYPIWEERTCGVPIVKGHIYDKAVRILIDTGVGSDEIGISKRLYEAIKNRANAVTSQVPDSSAANGQTYLVTRLESIVFEIGGKNGYQFQVACNVYPKMEDSGYDMFIGMSVLRHFRITINYPRRQMTFTPYVSVPKSVLNDSKVKPLFTNFFATHPSVPPPDPKRVGYYWHWNPIYGWESIPDSESNGLQSPAPEFDNSPKH